MSQTTAPAKIYAYEAMFMISQAVAADFSGAIAHINEILSRGHAELISMKKWDERRLAYEIKGQKRAIFILAYFKATGEGFAHIERDCNLSEKIMRALIVRCDHLTIEEMQAADGRKDLEIEAKLRAERAVAPVEQEIPEPAGAAIDDMDEE
ncbi:MAG: 30S ribosomal protein S6 [Phycisphaeraceae bacterium]|nr:MAG: 30S ribosomal protein S6 [Phycisphaeraceae bacterium]